MINVMVNVMINVKVKIVVKIMVYTYNNKCNMVSNDIMVNGIFTDTVANNDVMANIMVHNQLYNHEHVMFSNGRLSS